MTLGMHELATDLARWEGFTTWMYLCTAGKVTVGIGNMLRTAEDAAKLPFVHPGPLDTIAATPEQIADGWRAVKACEPGKAASTYAPVCKLRLLNGDVIALAEKRLSQEFLPGLRRLWPDFDTFPEAAQRALVDMAWNLGLGGLAKFSHLKAAVTARDWEAAARSCGRSTSRVERNQWTRQLFRDAGLPGSDDPTVRVRMAT